MNHLDVICRHFGVSNALLAEILKVQEGEAVELRSDKGLLSRYGVALKALGGKLRIDLATATVLTLPNDKLLNLYIDASWRERRKLLPLPVTRNDLYLLIKGLCGKKRVAGDESTDMTPETVAGRLNAECIPGSGQWDGNVVRSWAWNSKNNRTDKPLDYGKFCAAWPKFVADNLILSALPTHRLLEWVVTTQRDGHVEVAAKPMPCFLLDRLKRAVDP